MNDFISNTARGNSHKGFNFYYWGINDFTNNTANGNKYGFFLRYSSRNKFYNNTAKDNSESGFYLTESNTNYLANNTADNNGYGFALSHTSNCKLKNNSASRNQWGFYLSHSNSNIFSKNRATKNNYGIYFSATDSTISNCTVSSSPQYDIFMRGSSHVTAINSHFNKSSIYFQDSTSTLTVQWFLHVFVCDPFLRPIPSASVDIYNVSGDLIRTLSTGSDGWVRWILLTEYVETSSGRIYNASHTVVLAQSGIYQNYVEVTLNASKSVVIPLSETQPPIFHVSVTSGLQYSNENVEYDIIASVQKNGRAYPYTSGTALYVTIYDDEMDKVVDNAPMNPLDLSLGLYHYNNTTVRSGVFFVVVHANISGTHCVGMTSFEVVNWIGEITNINSTVPKIDAIAEDVNFINSTTLHIIEELALMNESIGALQANVNYLNTTLTSMLEDLAVQIGEVNESIMRRLQNLEMNISVGLNEMGTTFLTKLAEVNLTLYNEIQNVLRSITDEIKGVNSTLSAGLTYLLDNITEEHNSLRMWLDEVLGEVMANLTEANKSLHAHLDDLAEMMEGFYNETLRILCGVREMLVASEDNLTAELMLLNNTINTLHSLTLAEFRERIATLSENLSVHHRAIGETLQRLNSYITTFENATNAKLAEINETLVELSALETIVESLEDLDRSLDETESVLSGRIGESSKEQKSKLNLQTALLVIIIVLLLVSIIMNFMERKEIGGKGTPKYSSPRKETGVGENPGEIVEETPETPQSD